MSIVAIAAVLPPRGDGEPPNFRTVALFDALRDPVAARRLQHLGHVAGREREHCDLRSRIEDAAWQPADVVGRAGIAARHCAMEVGARLSSEPLRDRLCILL